MINAQIPVSFDTSSLELINNNFIETIEQTKGISIEDPNVEVEYHENGTVSIHHQISEDEYQTYTSLSQEEMTMLNDNPDERWVAQVLKGAVLMMKIAGNIKLGCKVLQSISDFDVCGYALQVVKDNIMVDTRYEIVRSLIKETCPYPPNSAACNQPPFVYWQTSIKKA